MTPQLLMLPGLLCSPRVFRQIIPRLGQAGIDAIVEPTHHNDDIRELARELLAHIAAPYISLAGFSFGGYVALEMASQAPGRIRGIALISTQARPDSGVIRLRRAQQVARARDAGTLKGVLRGQLPKLIHATKRPEGWERLLDTMPQDPHSVEWDSLEALPGSAGLVATLARMASEVGVEGFANQQACCAVRSDHRETLKSLVRAGVPILQCFGREDELIPLRSHMQLYEELIIAGANHKGASHHGHPVTLRELAHGTAHMPPLERPDDVAAAIIEWMQKPSQVQH